MIVTLAAWSIALVETSQPTHMIPSVFLYLIFWSCIMVSVLALLSGVVLGYLQANHPPKNWPFRPDAISLTHQHPDHESHVARGAAMDRDHLVTYTREHLAVHTHSA